MDKYKRIWSFCSASHKHDGFRIIGCFNYMEQEKFVEMSLPKQARKMKTVCIDHPRRLLLFSTNNATSSNREYFQRFQTIIFKKFHGRGRWRAVSGHASAAIRRK